MAAKRVNERRSRYNARRRILSEWHFCHGDVSRSSLLPPTGLYCISQVLGSPAPWDALRQYKRGNIWFIASVTRTMSYRCRCRTRLTCIIWYKTHEIKINSDEIELEMSVTMPKSSLKRSDYQNLRSNYILPRYFAFSFHLTFLVLTICKKIFLFHIPQNIACMSRYNWRTLTIIDFLLEG